MIREPQKRLKQEYQIVFLQQLNEPHKQIVLNELLRVGRPYDVLRVSNDPTLCLVKGKTPVAAVNFSVSGRIIRAIYAFPNRGIEFAKEHQVTPAMELMLQLVRLTNTKSGVSIAVTTSGDRFTKHFVKLLKVRYPAAFKANKNAVKFKKTEAGATEISWSDDLVRVVEPKLPLADKKFFRKQWPHWNIVV